MKRARIIDQSEVAKQYEESVLTAGKRGFDWPPCPMDINSIFGAFVDRGVWPIPDQESGRGFRQPQGVLVQKQNEDLG